MDFVFTVGDKTAAEAWPGQPMTAHWGVEDPVAAEGEVFVKKSAFATAFRELRNRIWIFVNLPLESIDRLRLQEKLDKIGRIRLSDAEPAT
jgi:arsenate reductase